NTPRKPVVWERAKQKAEQLGIAKSAYFPVLTGIATFADERFIEPFPKPFAPRASLTAARERIGWPSLNPKGAKLRMNSPTSTTRLNARSGPLLSPSGRHRDRNRQQWRY